MALIDRVKHDAASDEELAFKFPGEELRLGTQLIVNQAQEALLVKGGKALDLFGPGTHSLATGNLPLLRRLINRPFGGQTPFTAEVWFVNRHVKRDLRWGTPSPVNLVDPRYNFPISVRARGTWGLRIEDSRAFITQIVGTLPSADSGKIFDYFIGLIVQRFSDALAKYFVERGASIFDIAARLNDLSQFTESDMREEFGRFGIEVINFNVVSISIPQEEKEQFQEVLRRRMEIEQISGANVGPAYTTMRTFDTLDQAASNEGGGAGQLLSAGLGLGVGLGAGMPVGQQMGSNLNVQPGRPGQQGQEGQGGEGPKGRTPPPSGEPPPSAEPPPESATGAQAPQAPETPPPGPPAAPGGGAAPAGQADPVAKLQQLKALLDGGLITQDDYDAKKAEILKDL